MQKDFYTPLFELNLGPKALTLPLINRPGFERRFQGLMSNQQPIEILMVDDNPGDARLTKEAFKEVGLENRFHWMPDGDEALAFLRRVGPQANAPRPDLILLDLNMPRVDGRQVLAQLKADETLQEIPVIILTTSQAEDDVIHAYKLKANCYINKPVSLGEFIQVVQSIKHFWFILARRPSQFPTSSAA